MASKKRTTIEPEELNGAQADAAAESPSSSARPSTDYVVIVNLSRGQIQCPLANGRTVNLGPRMVGKEIHRSEPILKKLITPVLRTWERKGIVALEGQGGEA